MKKTILFITFILLSFACFSQTQEEYIKTLEQRIIELEKIIADAGIEQKEQKPGETSEPEEFDELSYHTGITYNDLARRPDDYIGQKVMFEGEVIQVDEKEETIGLRISVDSDNNFIIAILNRELVNYRILTEDIIKIFGTSDGLIKGESMFFGTVYLPRINTTHIKLLN